MPVSDSITQSHLFCLECGRKLRSLRRHLLAAHKLTPHDYRARWGLPADYPMIAPDYRVVRQEVAIETGLGYSRPRFWKK